MSLWRIFLTSWVGAAILTSSFGWASTSIPSQPGIEALDWAFTFASAIEADLQDKGMAQEATVMDYPELGSLDRAVERAAAVEGWRRGVVYADLAVELARLGRVDDARRLVSKADEVRRETSGWQGPRISAHIAQAIAYLGDVDQAGEISRGLAEGDARQYSGRMTATMAAAHGARDGYDAAIKALRGIDAADDLDTVWWRTVGYVELARDERFEEDQRRAALAAARHSARAIQGWKQAEVLTWLAREWRERDRQRAEALLEEADTMLVALSDDAPPKGPMLADLAGAWCEIGKVEHARGLLGLALQAVPHTMTIEQPASYARIAESYMAMRDLAQAREFFDRALTLASELVNSRPRALSLTAILRSMARAEIEIDDPTRARLLALQHGLGDPW